MVKKLQQSCFAISFSLFVYFFVQVGQGAQKFSDGHDLGILIMGTIINAKSADNVALVKESKSGRVKAVKPTHELLGFNVKAITAKYILLSKGSAEHLVYLDKFAAEFKNGLPSAPVFNAPVALDDHYREDGFERQGSQVRMSSKLRDKLVRDDLSTILMQATAMPEIVNGQIIGFKILQIDAGSIYDKAGIRDFDIITGINGIKLDSIPGAIKLLRSLKGENNLTLDVKRAGTQSQIKIDVAH